ncbi:unnamed protein product [Caenorhabditis auriculariae]|uniref:Uncharacterized protein n=1 Tax=Caenorhabditis auriculariae TaxID=2777116 RepID=A0A8S1HTB1_9PELO|nr:unnamed protein product [Caenorhabditis auriculariae]
MPRNQELVQDSNKKTDYNRFEEPNVKKIEKEDLAIQDGSQILEEVRKSTAQRWEAMKESTKNDDRPKLKEAGDKMHERRQLAAEELVQVDHGGHRMDETGDRMRDMREHAGDIVDATKKFVAAKMDQMRNCSARTNQQAHPGSAETHQLNRTLHGY